MDGLSTPTQVSPSAGRNTADTTKEYPPLSSRPSSSDACATIVQGLMMFNQSSDEEFSRKACESLVKKMKDKRDELDALIVSVYSRGEDIKKCITIARTLDGRLQVAGRKGFPHVVYAKIFRWPDLHKNELKHLQFCENAFDLKVDSVCVNPYHYERVINAGMGSMDVKTEDDVPDNSGIILDDSLKHLPEVFYSMNTTGPKTMHPLIMDLGPPAPAEPMFEQLSPQPGPSNAPNRYMNFNSQMVSPQQQQNMMMRQNMMQAGSSHAQMGPPQMGPPHSQAGPSRLPPPQQQPQSSQHQQQHPEYNPSHHPRLRHVPPSQMQHMPPPQRPQQPMQPPVQQPVNDMPPPLVQPNRPASAAQQEQRRQMEQHQFVPPHMQMPPPHTPSRLGPTVHEVIDISESDIIPPAGLPPFGHIYRPDPYPIGHPLCEIQDNYKTIGNLRFSRRNLVCVTNAEPEDPPLQAVQNWGKVFYHEEGRMLQQFDCKLATVYMDCGYAVAANRFCLGSVCRLQSLMGARADRVRLIGKGIRLSCKENGDVWVQNYGHNAVFVQSYYLDREAGRGVGDVIHKLYTGARIKIYDAMRCQAAMKESWLSTLMEKCRMVSTGEISADDDLVLEDNLRGPNGEHIALPLAKDCKDDPLTELFRFCNARLSFVEGWGPDCEGRETIDDCWAWIDIKINDAYAYLDTLLTEAHDAIYPLPPVGASRPLIFD